MSASLERCLTLLWAFLNTIVLTVQSSLQFIKNSSTCRTSPFPHPPLNDDLSHRLLKHAGNLNLVLALLMLQAILPAQSSISLLISPGSPHDLPKFFQITGLHLQHLKPKLDHIYLKALITSCSFCASSRAHLASQSFKAKGINEWKVFCPETQIVKWTSPDSLSVFKRKRYKPTSSPCTWMNTCLLQKSLHLCIFFSWHTNLPLEFEVQGIPSPRPI